MTRRRGVEGRSGHSGSSATIGRLTRKSAGTFHDLSSEQEERKFARPDKISPHLFCVICSEVFKNPYRAPCGHSYCFSVTLFISNPYFLSALQNG